LGWEKLKVAFLKSWLLFNLWFTTMALAMKLTQLISECSTDIDTLIAAV